MCVCVCASACAKLLLLCYNYYNNETHYSVWSHSTLGYLCTCQGMHASRGCRVCRECMGCVCLFTFFGVRLCGVYLLMHYPVRVTPRERETLRVTPILYVHTMLFDFADHELCTPPKGQCRRHIIIKSCA